MGLVFGVLALIVLAWLPPAGEWNKQASLAAGRRADGAAGPDARDADLMG